MYAMRLAQAAAAGLALLVVAPPSPAQWRDMRPEGASMTREDLDYQRASTQALLDAEPPPVGRSREWHNTETGAHGTVTMLRAFENRGAPCRAMRYAVMTRGRGQPVETTFTLCRTADGEWKIAS